MKKIYLFFALWAFLAGSLSAQVPQKFSWQGIVRDAAGMPLTAPVELRFTISQGASAVFTEQTALTPNAFGLVVWNIGEKETAAFEAIDWAGGAKTLNVEMRTTVGSGNFTSVGSEELKSVPYALVAGKTLSDQDNQTLTVNGNTLSIAGGNTVTLPADGDGSPTNEIQTIALSGQTLTLSDGGGSVILPTDGDGSATNEIQTISLNGQTLTLSNGGGAVDLPAGTAYTGGSGISVTGNVITNTGDADNNPSNEIQSLSLAGQTLSLSNGGGTVTLPDEAQTLSVSGQNLSISGGNTVALPADGDGSPTNEIQQLTLVKDSLQLSNGGGLVLLPDTSAVNEIQQLTLVKDSLRLSNGGGFVALKDTSSTNEIQQLTLVKDSLRLSNGGGFVTLKDNSSTNEIQTISLSGNQLSLSQGGGSITLPAGGGNYWTSSSGNIYNTNGGNVGIGQNFANAKLDVAGDLNLGTSGIAMTVSNSEAIWYNGYYSWGYGGYNNYFNSNMSVEVNVCCWALEVGGDVAKPGGGSWSALSDARYKKEVQPFTDGLESVLKINPVRYHYNETSGYDSNPEYVGVIAQELRPVAPYMVKEMPAGLLNGAGNATASAPAANAPAREATAGQTDAAANTYLSVDNSAMTYMLINAVKEQQAQIKKLEARIAELEKGTAQATTAKR